MDKMRIRGGRKLQGVVEVGGSKNAALPILISSLLTAEPCSYRRVPKLQDIQTTLKLLRHLGTQADARLSENRVSLRTESLASAEAPYDLVRTMRASVLVLGPLTARFGQAKVSLPGGCAIGARPIGFHLDALRALGAEIELEGGYVIAKAPKGGLRGARIEFPFPSVGATEQALMAAALAQGESVIENSAREPEIVDLVRALRKMGSELEGEGTSRIRIQGRRDLRGCEYEMMADRIQAGTYLAAGFITGGSVEVRGIEPVWLEAVLEAFEKAGGKLERGKDSIRLTAPTSGRPRPIELTTMPYPGFPTDMQAQMMALACIADGTSQITETIFENRFMHVAELARLGADISVRGNVAVINGRAQLYGAPLMATDLRASASLILAGLAADGETIVNRIYHLDRGYETIERKLTALGADIERLS